MLELFGSNGNYKYSKTVYWLKDRETEKERKRQW